MHISLKHFKKISQQFQALNKHVLDGNINVRSTYDSRYELIYNIAFTSLRFKSIAKMHAASKLQPLSTHGISLPSGKEGLERHIKEITQLDDKCTLQRIGNISARDFPSLKLIPQEIAETYTPYIIAHAPFEITEGDYTYRIISRGTEQTSVSSVSEIVLICRNDEPLYDYLDKGFYIAGRTSYVNNTSATSTARVTVDTPWLVSNEYNINTAHIFAMFVAQPQLSQLCTNGCFVNFRDAELLRLKMQKKLSKQAKAVYDKHSPAIEKDYKKNTTLVVVSKLINNEIEKTTINNIAFTKTSATYEHVCIEADDLLEALYKELNFNGEFDIYTVSEVYAKHIQSKLDDAAKKYCTELKEEPQVDVENPALNEAKEEENSRKKELPSFSVNGISITPAVSLTRQRYINNIRINREEIDKAIHRASCHRSQEEYRLFLKSVSKMSIKWHDIIANGLQVKIHEMSREEYAQPVPSPSAPALKFILDKKEHCVKICVDSERTVRVSLGRLIKRVETLNKRTDNKHFYPRPGQMVYRYVNYRNATWCAEELVQVLIDCCTFKKTVKNDAGENVEKEEVLITKADIVKLLDVANESKKAAIQRSKQFLDSAVKLTGAEIITFLDTLAYKVKGNLRTYAVVIKNAKVYDFDTKQYRCIVNDRHYAGAGYDDIAARLLALKNDSVMQDKIGTLRGAAQPNAENVHNDYVPDRDDFVSKTESVVDRVMANK